VVGKPGELARKYYADGADEIIYVDAVASLYQRSNIFGVVREAAQDVFIPLTMGGGVRTIEDAGLALRSGADKVAINSEAVRRPAFLKEAAEAFGSQCMVLSVQARARHGRWEALVDYGRENTGVDVLEWVQEAQALGVGEVLLTSVDREGTAEGFDIDLISAVREKVHVPLIVGGGCGSIEHVIELMRHVDVDAISFGSLFHYEWSDIPELKRRLDAEGFEVRS
jgi:cyclase